MSYRPICDLWMLARPKVKYYGAYPSGFLERARALLGVRYTEPVLHVCSGKIADYPFFGLGPNDKTLDLDPDLNPDYCQDARQPFPALAWAGVLADPPYTPEEAENYAPGGAVCPTPKELLTNSLDVLTVGRRVGILHRKAPNPPKGVKFVALVGVFMGYNNDARWYSVFEKR